MVVDEERMSLSRRFGGGIYRYCFLEVRGLGRVLPMTQRMVSKRLRERKY